MKKQKRTAVVIIKKYTRKWMARRVYLKLLSTITFIQCCYRQLRARKELQRLKQEAKELSIKPIGYSRTNHLEERGNYDCCRETGQLRILCQNPNLIVFSLWGSYHSCVELNGTHK
jgi:hypothetical protein